MEAATSTKLTKGGQTTVPRVIREALGIEAGGRVYWTREGNRAYISAGPKVPLSVTSAREFWDRIDQAWEDVEAGRVVDAAQLSANLRSS